MAFGKVQYLRDLCFGHFVSIDTAQPHALLVDMKHDARGLFPGTIEEMFQDVDDKLHRRVIVIQQQDLVHGRFLGLGPRLHGDAGCWTLVVNVNGRLVRLVRITHRFIPYLLLFFPA
mgnify:CR=1 FL=1